MGDRDLDRWLAALVMHWELEADTGIWRRINGEAIYHGAYPLRDYQWRPTQNIEQAWQVMAEATVPAKLQTPSGAPFRVAFQLWWNDANLWTLDGPHTAHEICNAILRILTSKA